MPSGRDRLSTIVFRSDDVQVDVVGTHVVHDRKPWRTGGSPRHGSLFDLTTSKPMTLPAYVPVNTFRGIIEDETSKMEVE